MPDRVPQEQSAQQQNDAVTAALLLAVNPTELGGAMLYSSSRARAEQWLATFLAMLPATAPVKRVPANVTTERLLGGLDFASTIAQGRAVSERGLLAEANEGCVVLSAATTRLSTYTQVGRALDAGRIAVERDGLSEVHAARVAVVVLQTVDDDVAPHSVSDRLAFHVALSAQSADVPAPVSTALLAEARERLPRVGTGERAIIALTRAAAAMGVSGIRFVLQALGAARAHAALHGRDSLDVDDIACATRLVLAPRAALAGDAAAPPEHPAEPEPTSPSVEPQSDPNPGDSVLPPEISSNVPPQDKSTSSDEALVEMLVQTARTALPPGMLTAFATRSLMRQGAAGRAGDNVLKGTRGRQVGVRRGDPRGGARLDLVATLRAAVPMQRVRRMARGGEDGPLVLLRREDFRIRQCTSPAITTALFVVDASGSSAMQRLAEAKGAVELMLAEGYARRDRVALITFRGSTAQVVLPGTHALARARRAISGLPAGGGTPLATALDLAATTATRLLKGGGRLVTVVLTDGRANVARDGLGGRARAAADAVDAATRLRLVCPNVVWIDTSRQSEALSRQFAECAGARYILLPSANAGAMAAAVHDVSASANLL